jgi:hypothetical protein
LVLAALKLMPKTAQVVPSNEKQAIGGFIDGVMKR